MQVLPARQLQLDMQLKRAKSTIMDGSLALVGPMAGTDNPMTGVMRSVVVYHNEDVRKCTD